jgi:hypothetical protein
MAMIGCHLSYFEDCIRFIFKQDYLGPDDWILYHPVLYHSIQNVSLIIISDNLLEESIIPHHDDILRVS